MQRPQMVAAYCLNVGFPCILLSVLLLLDNKEATLANGLEE